MDSPLRVGDVLTEAGGWFGRDCYEDLRVEAIGADWVVAREIDAPYRTWTAERCDPDFLTQHRIPKETS